jgi:hypothetical protein
MQIGTWKDPISKDNIYSVQRQREIGRAKEASAPPRNFTIDSL